MSLTGYKRTINPLFYVLVLLLMCLSFDLNLATEFNCLHLDDTNKITRSSLILLYYMLLMFLLLLIISKLKLDVTLKVMTNECRRTNQHVRTNIYMVEV